MKDKKLLHQVQEVVWKNKGAFAGVSDTKLGKCSLVEFEVELKEGARPVRHRSRPLNPRQQASLDEQIKLWLSEGVAEEAIPDEECYISPLVPVPKSDGGTRWCVDFRSLNAQTKMQYGNLPRVEDNLTRLGGSTVFSSLDASWAYSNVQVKESSRKYMFVAAPGRMLRFNRMTFGLSNAGYFLFPHG